MGRHSRLDPNFWGNVKVGAPDECWEWQRGRTKLGYGKMQANKKPVGAHRVACELAHGPIPDGMVVMHSCDNPPCCNPAHLSIGTYKDNGRDMNIKGRMSRKLNADDIVAMRNSYAQGTSLQSLAEHFNISDSQVCNIVHGLRWNHVGGPISEFVRIRRKGPKLLDDEIRLIRLLAQKGATRADIAERFGITVSNVCQIVARRTWRHVTDENEG